MPGARAEYARQVADAIIAQICAGTAPWMKPWRPGFDPITPHNPTTGKPYRGANALWLMATAEERGYHDTRWLTYRQAAAQGAQVRRGESGTRIQYWMWEGEEPWRDEDGRERRDEQGRVLKQRVRYERPRVFTAVVFNAEQTDGLPPPAPTPVAPEWERHDRAEALLRASGAEIQHVPGDAAFYDRVADAITLPDKVQFSSADLYYAVAFHELGHWTGHESRLARDFGRPNSPERAREELRAEIASLMLGDALGIGHDPSRHAAYVESWIELLKDDPREIFRAAADAEKVRGLVLGFERLLERGALAEVTPEPPTPVLGEIGHGLAKEDDVRACTERQYLHVPYIERHAAKAAAQKAATWIRWDGEVGAWYLPAGIDTAPFARWLRPPTRGAPDPVTEFATALQDAGLRVEGAPLMDGALHRVAVEGDKPGERSGAYKGYLDGHPAGYIENFKTGFKQAHWKSSLPLARLTAGERDRLRREAEQRRKEREAEREARYQEAAAHAAERWAEARPLADGESHRYLNAKGVPALGELRVAPTGELLVPICDADGNLQSLQAIAADGRKSFQKNGRIGGGMFVLPPTSRAAWAGDTIVIAEGYATAATVARATECPVIVAFNAANLEAVARVTRERSPAATICIAADNDEANLRKVPPRPNVGREKAEKAAAAFGAAVLLPTFDGLPSRADGAPCSDWNDLESILGRDAVRERLLAALAEARARRGARERVHASEREERALAIER